MCRNKTTDICEPTFCKTKEARDILLKLKKLEEKRSQVVSNH